MWRANSQHVLCDVVKLGAAEGALRSSRQTTLVCVNAPPVVVSVCVCHFTLLQR
jgi:hypothetical protein